MKKTLLALSFATLMSQTALASNSFVDQALEIVPRTVLSSVSYMGKFIENHPGKALAVMGALGVAAYEKHKTLHNQVIDLQAIARTPFDGRDNANRETLITNATNRQYRLTLTLSPLGWLTDIINTFINFRSNR